MASAPVALGALLKGYLRPPGPLTTNIDETTWRQVVGPTVARRALPLKLQAGLLTVRVATSAWAQQLSMMREELCRLLRERDYKVNDIKFSVGLVQPPRRLIGGPIFVPYRHPVPLPRTLEHAIAQIPDPVLRLTLARAASANLAWQRSVEVTPQLESPIVGLIPPAARPPGRR